MSELTFGEPLHLLDAGEYHPWVAATFDSVKQGARLRLMGVAPLLRWLLTVVAGRKINSARVATTFPMFQRELTDVGNSSDISTFLVTESTNGWKQHLSDPISGNWVWNVKATKGSLCLRCTAMQPFSCLRAQRRPQLYSGTFLSKISDTHRITDTP
jgi:hypothetical protein